MPTRKKNPFNDEIGIKLRQIRKEKKLTIEELAKLSDVSGITISNIENGRSNPTLNSLWRLADSLNVPLTKLLGYSHTEKEISSLEEAPPYFTNDLKEGWLVQPIFQEDDIEIFRVCLKGESATKRSHQVRDSKEIITVMSGELELRVGDKSYHLKAYDSINFDSGNTHEYINHSSQDLLLNVVVKYKNI
ncbi:MULTISPECIES: XRE family transcriptional regulator [Vagococcus]|uniref:helix-turn-helix domain-containing protein n=1 Tax=Vagococcus TaxID=2737 RepID=UPI002FC88419